MKLSFLFLLSSCFLSCTKQTAKPPSNPEDGIAICFPTTATTISVALNNCAEKTAETQSPLVCFEQLVEDSRCPLNANCVWEGVAVGRFSLKAGSVQHNFTLATKKFSNRASTDTVVAGVRIELLTISPYPGAEQGPAVAKLQIN